MKRKHEKITFWARLKKPQVEKLRALYASHDGEYADLFEDLITAYEEKHLKKGGLFRFGKKEAI